MNAAALSPALLLGLPSAIALVAYLLAALLDASREGPRSAALGIGWVAQGVAIVVDIAGLGSDQEGARFGFAPALSLTVWLVLAVYLVERRFVPLTGGRRVLTALALLVVAVAWAFPAEIRPQAPSRWAPLHWVLGFVSYGLFGAAVLHAAMLSRAERALRAGSTPPVPPHAGLPLLRLERLTFRFVGAGFIALSAALVLGARSGIGAAAWHWDHKTVFSVLGWLVFASLLVGRRAFGWRGPAATRGVYAGAVLLLLGYVGSRFVFEVLLHRPPG